MKSVYISPEKPSELMPLLAEGLLLYDQVIIDVTLSQIFNVIASNIDFRTFEYLIDNDLLRLVFQEKLPIIGTIDSQLGKTILLLSGIQVVDESRIDEAFDPIYPKPLTKKIKDTLEPTKVNYDLILDNSYADLHNSTYITTIFNYVRDYFDLGKFAVEIDGTNCKFKPLNKNSKEEIKEIEDFASYGLHLIAEINYRLSLLSCYDEIMCEKEFEIFFTRKLNQVFKQAHYQDYSSNLLELCEIHDFPDFKELISSRIFDLDDILKLRKGEGQILRHWLDNATKECGSDKIYFSKKLAKELVKGTKNISLPSRTVVFGLMQGLSYIKPIAGGIVSAVDKFIIPKATQNWKPMFFFDKARKLYIQKEKKISNG